MNLTKRTKAVVIASAILVSLIFAGALSVYAADSAGTLNYPEIVDRIAKAFNLDPAKVNDVFNQYRKDKQAEALELFQKRFESMLDQAVKNGEITQAQKDAILSKMADVRKKRDEIDNSKLTAEERANELALLRQDVRDWAEKNGIDPGFVMPMLKGYGRMRGMGGPMGGPMRWRSGGWMGGRGWFQGNHFGSPPTSSPPTGTTGASGQQI